MQWAEILAKLAGPLVDGVKQILKAAGASEDEAREAIREAATGPGLRQALTREEREELRRRAADVADA